MWCKGEQPLFFLVNQTAYICVVWFEGHIIDNGSALEVCAIWITVVVVEPILLVLFISLRLRVQQILRHLKNIYNFFKDLI